MRILGLSSFRHDSSAALLEDGKIIAAVEDAKLSRFPARGLPESAIKFCLAKAGATWHDLDAIAVSTRPLRGRDDPGQEPEALRFHRLQLRISRPTNLVGWHVI
jgi:predicted NodU family carbamoyl transferase